MANAIKTLACPQCGSAEQTEVKPGFYRCKRCGAEYFLDNDNVTVTHTHRHEWVAPAAPTIPAKRIVAGIGVFCALAIGIPAIVHIVAPTPAPSYGAYSGGSSAEDKKDPNEFSWSSTESVPLVVKDAAGGAARPVVLLAGKREYKDAHGFSASADPRNGLYVTFYDPLTGAEVKTQRLGTVTPGAQRLPFTDLDLRVFSGGIPYLLVNDNQLYEVDPVTLTLTDVTTKLFARQAALATGVATIDFDQDRWGDGLELLANDGKKYHYYPVVDKLYDEQTWYQATHAHSPALPTAAPRTYFTFTGRSFEYKDAPVQLLKIRYLANSGGPEYRLENPSWSNNYGGSGVFHSSDPHVKELIGPGDRQASRILDFDDLTPGRSYFDPVVRYSDASALLITLRTTAAPNSPLRLQCLDPATGAIRWTTPLGEDDEYETFVRFKDGFVATDDADCTVYGPDGKVQKSLELKYEPKPAS